MTELLVVGVDGAGFHLLEDWLAEGRLPNLAALRERGGATRLRSSLPPVTCPAWRCLSTGVNPGKHGVFWWENVDRAAGSFSVPTSADFHAPDLWDYLGARGMTSAVVNVPTTYPPDPIEGWMVSGGGGVDGTDYTHPPGLQAELAERFDYRVFAEGTSSNIGDDPDRVEAVMDLVDARFDATEYLLAEHDPDLLWTTVFYTNVFHHFFWDDEVTLRLWQHLDDRLGEFVGDANVLLVSDHGSNPIDYEFAINAWLEREGYLVTGRSVTDGLAALGLTRDRVTRLVDRFGLKNALKRTLPRAWVERLPGEGGSASGQGKADKIDWAASTAMASGQGPVYVLTDDPAERRAVAERLREDLATVTTPDGRSVARAVHHADVVYEGPFVADGPDLVLEQADGIQISGDVGRSAVFSTPDDWVAENHRDGVLFAAGPDVDADADLPDPASIYDVAPTALHWLGHPVPVTLDGDVLEGLFDDGSAPGSRPVEQVPLEAYDLDGDGPAPAGEDRQREMRDRLEDLGYLG